MTRLNTSSKSITWHQHAKTLMMEHFLDLVIPCWILALKYHSNFFNGNNRIITHIYSNKFYFSFKKNRYDLQANNVVLAQNVSKYDEM